LCSTGVVSNSTLSVELARRALHEEQQAQLKAALPAMRERLTVLIERRAGTLAEETYEERTRVETEAVKTELTETTVSANEGAAPAREAPPLG
jgi:hypothetical protein